MRQIQFTAIQPANDNRHPDMADLFDELRAAETQLATVEAKIANGTPWREVRRQLELQTGGAR